LTNFVVEGMKSQDHWKVAPDPQGPRKLKKKATMWSSKMKRHLILWDDVTMVTLLP